MTHREEFKNSFKKLLLISSFLFALASCDDCDSDFPYYSLVSSQDGKYHLLYSAYSKSFWIYPGEVELLTNENYIHYEENILSGHFNPFSFSHKNKYLAYPSEKTGNREITELNLENLKTRILASHPAQDDHPCYSPDGKFLAFLSCRSGSSQIWLLYRSTNKLKQLTNDKHEIEKFQFIDDHTMVFQYEYSSELYSLKLKDNSNKLLIEDVEHFRCYPEHGIIIYIYEYLEDSDYHTRCLLYDINSNTSRFLGNGIEPGFASLNLPVSPDGKYFLLSSEHAIWALPIQNGSAHRFSLPTENDIFMDILSATSWMPDSKSFRYFLIGAQFKGNIEDKHKTLEAKDQFSLYIQAITDLEKGNDEDFLMKAEILPKYPHPKLFMLEDFLDTDYEDIVKEIQFISKLLTNDFKEASKILINDERGMNRGLAVLLDILETNPKEVSVKMDKFIIELEEKEAEEYIINEWKRFRQSFESLNIIHKKRFQKLLKPLIKESYLSKDVDYFGKLERKVSPEIKKVERYVNFHPFSPISGKLSFRLADIFENYDDLKKAAKYYRVAARDKDLRLKSLSNMPCILKKINDKPERVIEIYKTIINEFPDTEQAREARLNAGMYLIKNKQSERAFEFLFPLVLKGSNSETWKNIKDGSPDIFKGLVLAKYSEGYYDKTKYLADIIDRPWPDKATAILFQIAGDIFKDANLNSLLKEDPNSIKDLEKILVYCSLNDPKLTCREFNLFNTFYYFRKADSHKNINARWIKYAESNPDLKSSYSYSLIMALLSYDENNYQTANDYFNQAFEAISTVSDSCNCYAKYIFRLSSINIAHYNQSLLFNKIIKALDAKSGLYGKDDMEKDIYLNCLSRYAKKRPKGEIKDFVLAREAIHDFRHITPYQVFEFEATETEVKEIGKNFIEKYPESPLTGVILYELEKYEEVLEKFPDSMAGIHALRKNIDKLDKNKNYWLAAKARSDLLKHPLLDENDKIDILKKNVEIRTPSVP